MATGQEFQRKLERVTRGLEEFNDEAVMRVDPLVRHAYHQIGADAGPSIVLSDEHACRIRHRERLDRILGKSDDLRIVTVDVHY